MAPRDRRDELPVPAPARTVGIRVGNQVYAPVLADDAYTAAAQTGMLNAQATAVIAMDRYYALAAAFAARRTVIWRPTDELEAARREQAELDHQDALAEKRREKEMYEADLATLEVKHRLEATATFRDRKFEVGDAKFAEKIAKFRVGEAVARAGLHDDEAAAQEKPTPPKATSILDHLAARAQELDEQIQQAEAGGKPTDRLRGELDVLNGMLRREILRTTNK
jgi:hypothetical protein